ncbi:MAG TPA: SDR family oxidoreductase [Gaiellaceae bacterium]|nr:SDR family oxidoreductase [Gaiellaceae bacterium]
MKILVLGGTRFLGRAIVESALEQGHEPTLFNRGLTGTELFPDVEKLRGDRASDLSALDGRTWDAVIDVAAYFPDDVRRSTEALNDRAGRYVFVSSVSVYADHSVPQHEGAAVLELQPGDERDDGADTYGARKAACERIVEEPFGDSALIVRPGLIVGPHDPTGRFTYWPHRIARGGEVLAPASPDYAVQFVDVRDLGAWIVRATADDLGGTFNATGETMPLGELLDACIRVTGGDARPVWVPSDRLLEAGAEEWMGVPLWIVSPGWEAVNRVPVSKAIAAGLRFRPLEETILGTLHEAEPVDGVGLTPERERELLALS